MEMQNCAYLSNQGCYTLFSFRGKTITFLTSKRLERYTKIKEWGNGYLVVMAKYLSHTEEEEEYIDLLPILENLYMDSESFLRPIEMVEVKYV